jgi:predicted nucleotidyltransferase component of viral defense system
MLTDTQIREVFHFCFLERLLKISSADIYVLKGGVNLRFFFNSPRYSEDMDLDVLAGNVATLKKNGYKILQDNAFKRGLRTYGIADIELNDPEKAKQTETTQRFRAGLITPAGLRLPTKIEFSRRQRQSDKPIMTMINPDIARQYHKLSYRCQHYPGEFAALQKVRALAGRSVAQARDVFDLGILHAGGYTSSISTNKLISGKVRQQAIDNLLGLSYEDFIGQVAEFLDAEHRKQYDSAIVWEQLQETVLKLLGDA